MKILILFLSLVAPLSIHAAPDRAQLKKEVAAMEDAFSAMAQEKGLLAKECPMLVLSRKKNESIVINNDITIVVVEIRGDKVRLGIEAPKEVPVHRREVYDAIRRNVTGDEPEATPRDASDHQ